MRRVLPHLQLAPLVMASNVWVLQDAQDRRFLVDTGHVLERPALRAALWRAGLRGRGDVHAILLTHRHSDHAGNAAWLRQRFQCPVLCHPQDAPFLSGAQPPPALARGRARFWEEAMCHLEDHFPAVTPVDDVYGSGAWRWGFRVVEVPGHTEGSVMLHHEPTATLFSGDAILSGPPPLRFIPWLYLAVPAFSVEVERCRALVRAFLAELPPTETLCAGHGGPVVRRVQERLQALARR